MTAPVEIKPLPSYRIQSVRGTIPADASIPARFDEVMANLKGHPDIGGFGACIAVYYNMPGQDWDIEIGFEVPQGYGSAFAMPNGESMAVHELAPVSSAACLMHKGPYSKLSESYGQLMQWIEANGYQYAGPCREVYLNDPEKVPPEELLTELQFPVFKR